MNRTVTLYGHWTCPSVHRVAWALAERGIGHWFEDQVERSSSAALAHDAMIEVSIDG